VPTRKDEPVTVTVSPTLPLAVLRFKVARFVHAKAVPASNAIPATAVPTSTASLFLAVISVPPRLVALERGAPATEASLDVFCPSCP